MLWNYLLILGKSRYIWATLSQWDKYLVTQLMLTIDPVLTLGGADFAYHFENERFRKKRFL